MIVECGQGHKNRVPDAPAPGKSYRCGRCKEPLHVMWDEGSRKTLPTNRHVAAAEWKSNSISKVLAVVSVIMLVLAAFWKWPYGFYTVLRLVACGSAVYLALVSKELKRVHWAWAMAVTALLFNPIVPIRMGRHVWMYLDMAAALLFGGSLLFIKPSKARVID